MKLHIILLFSLGTPYIIHAMGSDYAEILAIAAVERDHRQSLLQNGNPSLQKLPKQEATDHDDICEAFRRKDISTIEEFISTCPDPNQEIVDSYDDPENGYTLKMTTLLELAYEHNLPTIISLLREKEVRVDQQDNMGSMPLFQALTCHASSADALPTLYLLITEQSISHKDMNGRGILHQLLKQKKIHPEVIKLLVKQGADVKVPDQAGETPVHFAARRDSSGKVMEYMFDRLTDDEKIEIIDLKDKEGNTPLHLAIQRFIDVPATLEGGCIKYLLDIGASILEPNNDGITPKDVIINLAAFTGDKSASERAQKLKNYLDIYFGIVPAAVQSEKSPSILKKIINFLSD